jgi:hypothetical protein
MSANPTETLSRILQHYAPDRRYDIEALVEQSSFDKMKKLNSFDKVRGLRFGQKVAFDSDSRKVRRGVVHGYRDYLSDAEQRYFEQICTGYGL